MTPSGNSFYDIGSSWLGLEFPFRLDDSLEEYVYFIQKFKKKE